MLPHQHHCTVSNTLQTVVLLFAWLLLLQQAEHQRDLKVTLMLQLDLSWHVKVLEELLHIRDQPLTFLQLWHHT